MKSQKLTITEWQLCGRWGLTRTQKLDAKDSLAHVVHLQRKIATRYFSFETGDGKAEPQNCRIAFVWKMRTDKDQNKRKRDATDRLACIVHLHHRNTAQCLPYLETCPRWKVWSSQLQNHNLHNQMFHVNPNPNLPLSLTEREHLEVDLPQSTQRSFKYLSTSCSSDHNSTPSPLTAAHSILTPQFNPLTSLLARPLRQIRSQKLNKSHSQTQTQNSNHHRHPSVHTPNPRSTPLCTSKKISPHSPFPLINTITSKRPSLNQHSDHSRPSSPACSCSTDQNCSCRFNCKPNQNTNRQALLLSSSCTTNPNQQAKSDAIIGKEGHGLQSVGVGGSERRERRKRARERRVRREEVSSSGRRGNGVSVVSCIDRGEPAVRTLYKC